MTPSFVQAVVQDALAGTDGPTHPARGGLTDVGLHTGGQPRATAWPLARAIALAHLFQLAPAHEAPPWCEEEAVLEFRLFLLEAASAGARDGGSAAPPRASWTSRRRSR